MRAADGERHCLTLAAVFDAVLPTALLRVSSSHQPPPGSHWVTPATAPLSSTPSPQKRLALLLPAASSLASLVSFLFLPLFIISPSNPNQTCSYLSTSSSDNIVQPSPKYTAISSSTAPLTPSRPNFILSNRHHAQQVQGRAPLREAQG